MSSVARSVSSANIWFGIVSFIILSRFGVFTE